ncbi:MAG: 6-hydroxymethylpterin diphosphokinase MptE-like protein [Candidatus Altiarchaeota archaeon]
MHWKQHYRDIVMMLELDVEKDMWSRQVIHDMVGDLGLDGLRSIIEGNDVMVYGCGPSLEKDVRVMHETGRHKDFVNVAVDGAVKALLECNIIPDINVTDLDGDIEYILKAGRYGCVTVVHAHGDNVKALRKYVPHMEGRVYATTQNEPTDRVHNFGGFTDGDRAVHLVEHFKPKNIVLAGMDFGNVVGIYSGVYDSVMKPRKLEIGKELLERLASASNIPMYNATSSGEDIKGIRKVDFSELDAIIQKGFRMKAP